MLLQEEKIIDFLKKNLYVFGIILATVFAILVRKSGYNFITDDYTRFLDPWFNYIRENGGFLALKDSIGNYNIPYLFLFSMFSYISDNSLFVTKIISIIFDFIGAITAGLIVITLLPKRRKGNSFLLGYFLFLMSPIVFFNSSFWGQCDVIYSVFCMISLYLLLKNRYISAFVLYGVALSFKIQGIFFFPVLLFAYFSKKKFSFLNFFLIPIVYLIMIFPSVIAGRDISSVLSIYFGDVTGSNILSVSYPNIYYIFLGSNGAAFVNYWNWLSIIGIVIAFILIGSILYIVISNDVKISTSQYLLISIFSVYSFTLFLPGMHERYGFLAEALILIYCFACKRRFYLLLLLIPTFCTYSQYLFLLQTSIPMTYLSILNIVIYICLLRDLLKEFEVKITSEEMIINEECN